MADFNLIQNYGGRRLEIYEPRDDLPFDGETQPIDEKVREKVDLTYEEDSENWRAIDLNLNRGWRSRDWDERPVRFVDGKDVGYTVAWLRGSEGHPVPLRLSEIGSTVMRVVDRECRREFATVQRVLSMVAAPFPWEEVESFARELQEHNIHFLPASPPGGVVSSDFEEMRKAAQNRSNDEMNVIEELALAQYSEIPSVVDGRLEPRVGGFDPIHSPVFGVIKTHKKQYLHPRGIHLLYELKPAQRTPVFSLKQHNLSVISWYLRLAGGGGLTPDVGYVRIEASRGWFERRGAKDWNFVNKLSKTIYDYRCREASYDRAPISIHPIVRAEESLSSLFTPPSALVSQFYRLTKL